MNQQPIISAKNLLKSAYHSYQQKLNISQANLAQKDVENYVAQEADVKALTVNGLTYGSKLTLIRQRVNENIFKKIRSHNNMMGSMRIEVGYRQNINKIFSDKNQQQNIAHLSTEMANALKTFATTPTNPENANAAIMSIQKVTSSMKSMASSIQTERQNTDADLTQSVSTINSLLERIAKVNGYIEGHANAAEGDAFPYVNERRELLQQLSAYIQLDESCSNPYDLKHHQVKDIDGNILVSDTKHATFSFEATLAFTAKTQGNPVVFTGIAGNLLNLDTKIETHTGALYELVNLRDTTLPKLQQEIDGYAGVFRDALNELHNLGVPMDPPSELLSTPTLPFNPLDPNSETAGLSLETIISGNGTVRLCTTDSKGVLKNEIEIELTDNMTISNLIEKINNDSTSSIHATLTEEGRLKLTATHAGEGIIIGSKAGQAAPKLSTSTAFNAPNSFGFSHFFGFNNLLETPNNRLNDSVNGMTESITLRQDIAQSPKRLATGYLDPLSNINETVLNVSDVRTLEKMSNILENSYSFKKNTLVAGVVTNLTTYSTNLTTRHLTANKIAEKNLKEGEYILEGLSVKAQEDNGVNEQFELALSLDLVKSTSFVTRMLSLRYELEDAVLRMK